MKQDQIDWLLEMDNPSVRFFASTDILGKSENDVEVRKARDEIMEIGVVPKILAARRLYFPLPFS